MESNPPANAMPARPVLKTGGATGPLPPPRSILLSSAVIETRAREQAGLRDLPASKLVGQPSLPIGHAPRTRLRSISDAEWGASYERASTFHMVQLQLIQMGHPHRVLLVLIQHVSIRHRSLDQEV